MGHTKTTIALSAVITVLALAALACGDTSSGGGAQPAQATPIPTSPPCAGATLSGTGDSVIDVAHLATCKTATIAHNGSRHFAVTSYDGNDGYSDLLVNKTGAYSGTVKWDQKAASLEIKADGAWTITVK